MNLEIGSNGLLIILGDFSATNKIDVSNGGILVVTGSMNFSPGGQDEYSGGGDLFAGSISGNPDADAVDNPISQLETDYPEIFDFIESGGESPLPVVLVYFTGEVSGDEIGLSWATSFEEKFDYFIVEKSKEGMDFSEIGPIPSLQETESPYKEYGFTDNRPYSGLNYYRLKAVDLDGTYEYHKVIAVHFEKDLYESNFYPNPSEGSVITIVNPNRKATKAWILDSRGQQIFECLLKPFENEILFDQKLAPGIYFLYVDGSEKPSRMMVR